MPTPHSKRGKRSQPKPQGSPRRCNTSVSRPSSPDQHVDLFELCDGSRNGRITLHEFEGGVLNSAAHNHLQMNKRVLSRAFHTADANNSSTISREEFDDALMYAVFYQKVGTAIPYRSFRVVWELSCELAVAAP